MAFNKLRGHRTRLSPNFYLYPSTKSFQKKEAPVTAGRGPGRKSRDTRTS